MPKILNIRAAQNRIEIETDLKDAKGLELLLYNPYESPMRGQQTAFSAGPGENGINLSVDRYENGRDRQYLRFAVTRLGEPLEGPCCTQETVSRWNYPYPTAPTIKGLQVRDVDDAIVLGVNHAALNISQPEAMLYRDNGNALPFESQGKIYYFNRSVISDFDRQVRTLTNNGVIVNLILLNAPRWGGVDADEQLKKLVTHPDYDREGLISAFNTVGQEGVDYYIAFVEFLADRYMKPDQTSRPACGLIIANEVDSQWVWSNAGKKTVEEFTAQYVNALRLACLAARKMYAGARVYVSLDNFWNTPYLDDPLKSYHAKDVLDIIAQESRKDGDFPWNVAYHPYPEVIESPDFWNDKNAEYRFDTKRMTFKNIEVLCSYLRQPQFLYKGSPRHLILSEQGFNSDKTKQSEKLQAAAYCLAYKKLEKIPQIEAFILHAHVDNKDEFGLNLGIRRRDENSESGNAPGEPKPVYYIFRDIDRNLSPEVYEGCRRFIGEETFDDLLNIRDVTE